MLWLKHTDKPLNKGKNKIEITQDTNILSSKNDFKVNLKQSANLEIDNGNGYGIAKIYKLEDMI